MAAVSSDHVAVSPTILPAPPAFKQAQPDLNTRQGSLPPVVSHPAPDFAVSISPEARNAAAKARTAKPEAGTATEQKADSPAEKQTTERTKSALPAAESMVEKDTANVALRNKIERRKEEERHNEEELRQEEASANAAERRRDERKKAEKAANENQGRQANILNTVYEANQSSYENRMLIEAATSGYPSKQSGKAATVIGGTSADSTALFIQRNPNQGRSSINVYA